MHKKLIFIASIIILIIPSVLLAQIHSSQSYSLQNPRIIPSGGQAGSFDYSLCNISIGCTFGGTSESPNYTLQAGFVSYSTAAQSMVISLSPSNCSFNNIPAGGTRITRQSERIIIKNNSNIAVSLAMRVTDSAGSSWTAADTPDGNDINRYAICGIFTDTDLSNIGELHFNEQESDDLISGSVSRQATATVFASSISSGNGSNILPGGERALWLNFKAPRVDTTNESEHNLWLIIEAKEVN